MTAVLDCIVMVINLRLCLPQCFFVALTMQWDVSSVIYMHLLSSHWILICMQIVKSFLRLILHYVDCSAIKSLQRCSLQQTYKFFFLSFFCKHMWGFDFPFLHFSSQPKAGKISSTCFRSFSSQVFCVQEPVSATFPSPAGLEKCLCFKRKTPTSLIQFFKLDCNPCPFRVLSGSGSFESPRYLLCSCMFFYSTALSFNYETIPHNWASIFIIDNVGSRQLRQNDYKPMLHSIVL